MVMLGSLANGNATHLRSLPSTSNSEVYVSLQTTDPQLAFHGLLEVPVDIICADDSNFLLYLAPKNLSGNIELQKFTAGKNAGNFKAVMFTYPRKIFFVKLVVVRKDKG